MSLNESKPKFEVACDKCGKKFRASVEFLGKAVKCKKCGHTFSIGRPVNQQPDALAIKPEAESAAKAHNLTLAVVGGVAFFATVVVVAILILFRRDHQAAATPDAEQVAVVAERSDASPAQAHPELPADGKKQVATPNKQPVEAAAKAKPVEASAEVVQRDGANTPKQGAEVAKAEVQEGQPNQLNEPHVTSLLQLKAEPEAFVAKSFVIRGGIRIDDYYIGAYRNTKPVKYSLAFNEVDKTNDNFTSESAHLYLSKHVGKPVIDALLTIMDGAENKGATRIFKLARFRVTLLPLVYSADQSSRSLEILDVQFYNENGTWGPWLLANADAKAVKTAEALEPVIDLSALIG